MQGQKGAIGSLPESLGLEHGSSSSDSGVIEQPICWNNYMRNPQENHNISMWSMGESSSSTLSDPITQSRVDQKTENEWPSLMKAYPERHQHEPSASMLSLGDVNNGHHGPLFLQSSRPESVPHYPGSNASSSSSDPFELQGRQLPSKRKAVELNPGESSSGIGSSNMFQRPEGSSNSPANPMPFDPTIPRLGLGVQEGSLDNRNAENTRRNVRIRINTSRQQDLPPVDLRPPPVPTTAENSSGQGQPAVRLPALRRNLQLSSRWNRSSSSRPHRSSNIAISGDVSRTIPANISDHPIFVQPHDLPNANWGLNGGGGGGNASNNGNGVPSRRLSEILRRSLLSSIDSRAGGGQNGNLFLRNPPSISTSALSSQESGIPPVVGIPNHHHHLDSVFGFPYLGRTVAGGREGRGRLASEIRSVLDLIRIRGEGVRFEDVMIMDPSVLYGMADIHDRHRDMRLDIDNMSYEELLALEERIGNVNTGLTEEIISSCLKQKTYASQPDAEPCCICQEEYNDGDELGALECGHDFHTSCIKQWLLQKNVCPVCKSAPAAATSK